MTKLVKETKYSIYVLFILDNTLHGYGYYDVTNLHLVKNKKTEYFTFKLQT